MSSRRIPITMNTMKIHRGRREETDGTRPGRLALWLLLALGLFLMLVSASHAMPATATRTDRFNGTMAAGQTVRVENVWGEVIASPGREFSAVVTLTAHGPTQAEADRILRETRIDTQHDDEGWGLETILPGMRSGRRFRRGTCEDCRVVARYEIVVPPGVETELQTVNGDVRVRDLDASHTLESVNGSIDARGVRGDLAAQTVNGGIQVVSASAKPGSSIELQSVNGSITLTLPKDAQFDFRAETMNGTIASTFPLPPRTPVPGRSGSRIVVRDGEGEPTVVELDELSEELEDAMKGIEIEIEEGLREAERDLARSQRDPQRKKVETQMRHIHVEDPIREYSGSIGRGGARVDVETLNGSVTLLAAGTREADAKSLVSERRSFIVTVPEVRVQVPAPRVPPVAPVAPVPPAFETHEQEVVRGNISGDFLSTTPGASYRLGNVSGRVKILTHSGEIRVAGIGSGADLKTFGGDIVLGPVSGDLKAITMAGDIRSTHVSGSALADTAGGDIRFDRVGGSLDARTSGGDIVVGGVGGSVRAVTAGGDVRIVIASQLRGSVTIQNEGGDVSLALPADAKADVELTVTGAPDDDEAIRSEFRELTLSRRNGSQRATLRLNGGGERVVVKTNSGMIRLQKTP